MIDPKKLTFGRGQFFSVFSLGMTLRGGREGARWGYFARMYSTRFMLSRDDGPKTFWTAENKMSSKL